LSWHKRSDSCTWTHNW